MASSRGSPDGQRRLESRVPKQPRSQLELATHRTALVHGSHGVHSLGAGATGESHDGSRRARDQRHSLQRRVSRAGDGGAAAVHQADGRVSPLQSSSCSRLAAAALQEGDYGDVGQASADVRERRVGDAQTDGRQVRWGAPDGGHLRAGVGGVGSVHSESESV